MDARYALPTVMACEVEKEIVLDVGESVLFYSDGFVEAHYPKGEMFGLPRLRALVAKYGEDRSLVDALLQRLAVSLVHDA